MTKYHTPQENVNEWQAPTQEPKALAFQQFEEELGSADELRGAEMRAQHPQDAYRHDVLTWVTGLGARPDVMDALDFAVEQPCDEEEEMGWD